MGKEAGEDEKQRVDELRPTGTKPKPTTRFYVSIHDDFRNSPAHVIANDVGDGILHNNRAGIG